MTSLALVVVTLATPDPGSAGTVSPDVEAALAWDGGADVIINLVMPPPQGPLGRTAANADRRQAVRAAQDRVLAAVTARGVAPRHRYEVVPALSAHVTAAGLAALEADSGVESVEVDAVGQVMLADTVPKIGGDVLHGLGLTGAGTTVAVLDTGIDTDHPDLADSLVAERCFCSLGGPCCPNGQTTQSGPGAAEDDRGHGTWVSGVVASNGVVAPVGVAPDAGIVAVKVIGAALGVLESDVIAGLDWLIANQPGIDAVNMSLGFVLRPCGSAMQSAVAGLTANGVALFAASGNESQTIAGNSPANCEGVVGVGAVSKEDVVESYSNSGPVVDLLAPGTNILTTGLGGGTRTVTFGTSFASPHAAGAAALLRGAFPGLTPSDLLAILQHTGVPLTDTKNGQTNARIDVAAAYAQLTTCGNGVREGTEDCDGGAANGTDDCCTAVCVFADRDRDGVCNRDDVCPDDADNDSDADGACVGPTFHAPAIEGDDPCSRTGGAGAWATPKVRFKKLLAPAGEHEMLLRGELPVPVDGPPLAPATYGVHLRVTDAAGARIVDEHIPGGVAFGTPARVGWRSSGGFPFSKWTWIDKEHGPPAHNGIAKLAVRDLSKRTPGLVAVMVLGKFGTYPLAAGQEPVVVELELNDGSSAPGALAGVDQCGAATFPGSPGPACLLAPGGEVLRCK